MSIVSYLKETNLKGAIVVTTPQEVALMDVRKELNFCLKTKVPILGVVENMSGFNCPNCKECSELFEATTGGAAKMCADFKVNLLAKFPLDKDIIRACDKGESFVETYSENELVKEWNKLADSIIS